jgi:two-component system chemotaxis response regulator CheB
MEDPEHSTGPDAPRELHRDVVVIGASAGGVEALEKLVAPLPPEIPAAMFVVLHLLSTGTSVLPAILTRAGGVPARTAQDGDAIERGQIYVAPPDRHMLLQDGEVRLTRGPRENGHRPAVDPLFRSAARAFGPRVIAVILSGSLDDGAAGIRFVQERGGATLVQDPGDAFYSGMPESALEAVEADHVLPIETMGRCLCEMLETPVVVESNGNPAADEPEFGGDPLPLDVSYDPGSNPRGEPSGLTCPECGGALWENEEGPLVWFECRVGHGFSPESLVSEQSRALETALWAALQSLDERADIMRRLERRATRRESPSADRFRTRARATEAHAAAVRDAIARFSRSAGAEETDDESGTAA